MGKPIKVVDLAKRVTNLSGLGPILNSGERLKDDELAITVFGLRPGEKLFAELACGANLMGTIRSCIDVTVKTSMKHGELQALMTTNRDAIPDGDQQNCIK